jgi:hypothetical protein
MSQTATDLTVTLQEDRPGALAGAMDAIIRAGINLEGMAEFDGVLHVLTRDAPATTKALRGARIRVGGERPVLVVGMEDQAGAWAAMLRRLADAGLNVDYCYLATNTRLVIAGDDMKGIAKILAD